MGQNDKTPLFVPLAHTRGPSGCPQPLVDHLEAVAQLAELFASPLCAAAFGRYLGLWHDLGKFLREFQDYLRRAETNPLQPGFGPDHKRAGAHLAQEMAGVAAMVVQGHHGGLRTPVEFQQWLGDNAGREAALSALALAESTIPDLRPTTCLPLPRWVEESPTSAEFFVRLLFSAVVDADFLDTERHFQPDHSALRRSHCGMKSLWQRFEQYHDQNFASKKGRVNEVRVQVYRACVSAAYGEPGLYRLTVPTGGGKTLSALAFALRHSVRHGLARVVVALPYLSITEQTSEVFRSIFPEPGVVLEHHSEAAQGGSGEDPSFSESWRRLAAENWDAPVVVTTTVQLFESLFANRPAKARKLHRLAKSVLILDEAQALPPHLLTPLLDALRELALHYGSTVVLTTATQPAFEAVSPFSDLAAREIAPTPESAFRKLARVDYEFMERPVDWTELADQVRREERVLVIVNTKRDALAVLDALGDPTAFHLSTLLCGAHRRQVLSTVRERLRNSRPCRLVSTQVVEAGVDLDFPVVFRALGPLDSVIQAAGRCNREGKLHRGRVVVFRPKEGSLPLGAYRTATELSSSFLKPSADLNDPSLPRAYFAALFQALDTDRERVQQLRSRFEYPSVAERVRLIGQETKDVVVTGFGPTEERGRVRALIERLRRCQGSPRLILRDLQPYLVSLPARQFDVNCRAGLVAPILDGVGEWLGGYDATKGLTTEVTDSLIF